MLESEKQLKQLANWVAESSRIVFFGGAGVSTESGIPDFRSEDGLYRQHFRYPPEVMLSHEFFMEHPEEFFQFYREKMVAPQIEPNDAHRILARWEEEGRLSAVITQNIDGLHQKAGSRKVWELHGSVYRNHCMECGKSWPLEKVLETDGVPRCTCGGIIKPDVVLYGEGLDENVLQRSVQALERADLLIIGGTSLAVYPAAGLIQYYGGQRLVLINRSSTPMDRYADLRFSGKIGEVLRTEEEIRCHR